MTKIVHLNCRSVLKYLYEKRLLVSNCHVDVLSLNETRLEPSITDNEIAIDGYNVVRQDHNREDGGVLLYISNSLNVIAGMTLALKQ